MPYKENMFTQYLKSIKAPSLIYEDLESFIKRMRGCKNGPEKLSTPKVYTMFVTYKFFVIENRQDVYKSKGCMKMFCVSLQEHAIKAINLNDITNKQRAEMIC